MTCTASFGQARMLALRAWGTSRAVVLVTQRNVQHRAICNGSIALFPRHAQHYQCHRFQPFPYRKACTYTTDSISENGSDIVVLTDRCVRRLAKINEKYENTDSPKKILRVAVDSGGCSGYSYSFNLVDDTDISEDDSVFRKDGAVLVVDDISMDFLKGATVDYTMELIKRAFVITANPNVEDGCGCGISFSPKEEL